MFRRLAEALEIDNPPQIQQPQQALSTFLHTSGYSAETHFIPTTTSPLVHLSTPIEHKQESIQHDPESAVDPTDPDYKQWFFDIQRAKQQKIMDRCKELQAFQDIDLLNPAPQKETMGVSLDNVGKQLYSDPITLSKDNRMQKPPLPKHTIVERTYDPLSSSQPSVVTLSLLGSSTSQPVMDQEYHMSAKLYHRVVHPPLHMDIFQKGDAAKHMILEPSPPASDTTSASHVQSIPERIRDPSVKPEKEKEFDFCSDLPDTTLPPFDKTCLQKLFRSMGGLPAGKAYPEEDTMIHYNTMSHLGAVKQYIHTFLQNKRSSDLRLQLEAVLALYGMTPDSLVKRIPYQQGVEVFWFIPGSHHMDGFVRRTIERDLIQFQHPTPSGPFAMVQLTDIRIEHDIEMKWRVDTKDRFLISVNQPVDGDKYIFESLQEDKKGLFGDFTQTSLSYSSHVPTRFRALLPNIMKVYQMDSKGTDHLFSIHSLSSDPSDSSHAPIFPTSSYSLTCEQYAPFLAYEVDTATMEFQELRNPILFGQFMGRIGMEYHVRTEETMNVPGKKGFVRMNSARSCIHLPNIAYSAWKTYSMAIRLQSMPIKETILHFKKGDTFYNVIATPTNGSRAKLHIEHNLDKKQEIVPTNCTIALNEWYIIIIDTVENGFGLSCDSIFHIKQTQGQLPTLYTQSQKERHATDATDATNAMDATETCQILVGTNGYTSWPSIYSTVSFFYDIAWIHFFDYDVTSKEMHREAKANWLYTSFPDTPYSYKVRVS
uniref:Uncharacterized protein n=1 Tax=viral metagenome TaxID=1070528 RepID=A0A6C0KQZ1_9ZZZZ